MPFKEQEVRELVESGALLPDRCDQCLFFFGTREISLCMQNVVRGRDVKRLPDIRPASCEVGIDRLLFLRLS